MQLYQRTEEIGALPAGQLWLLRSNTLTGQRRWNMGDGKGTTLDSEKIHVGLIIQVAARQLALAKPCWTMHNDCDATWLGM